MSFFKINTDPLPTDPSVSDTDFKKFYSSVQRNMSWDTLLPFVEQAEERYIIPFISREFFEELNTEYNANGSISDTEKAKVFRYLKMALANYTMVQALPHLNMRVGDAGVNETITQDTTPVRQWTYRDALMNCHDNAFQFLDLALMWAELQVQQGNVAFDTFANSEAYTESSGLLIANATTLNKYFYINRSRKTYVSLRPYLLKAEELHIKPLLGEDMFAELKAEIEDNTLTAANKTLLKPIRNCLVSYMVQIASDQVDFTHRGNFWKVMEVTENQLANKQGTANDKQELLTKHERLALSYEQEIKNLLYTNLDSYPTFRDSDYNELADEDDTDDWFDDNFCAEDGAVII